MISRRWFASNNSPSVVAKLKESDDIDDKCELIYRPPNHELLMVATSICSVGSIICPAMLGMYAFDTCFEQNVDAIQEVSELQLAAMCTLSVATISGAYICGSIPLRIYNYEKQ